MIKFNIPYQDRVTYPIKASKLFEDLCNQVGLEIGSLNFTNADYMILGNPFTNNEDCRTVLSNIAQLAGGFAKIGRDNKVYIVSLKSLSNLLEVRYVDATTVKELNLTVVSTLSNEESNANEKIDGNNYFTDFSKNEQWGELNSLVLGVSDVEGENTALDDKESIKENGLTEITIQDNYFLINQEEREKAIVPIWNTLKGLKYLPFKTEYYGYPYLDVGDLIYIEDMNDKGHISYVLNHTFTFNGSFKGTLEAPALTKTQIAYKNTFDVKTKFKSAERKIDKINGIIEDVVEETTENSSNIAQLQLSAERITTRVSKTEEDIEDLQEQSISSVDVEYALSISTTTVPTTGWSTSAPAWEQGKYMWQRTVTTYADNTTETSNPTCISGAKGQDGTTGKGITSIVEYYAVSSSNSSAPADNSFSTTLQTMTSNNKYLWNYELITYTDNTTEKTTKRVIGVYGDKGQDGTNGTNGNDGKGINSIVNKYAVSTSNTTAPTNWQNTPQTMTTTNKYLWNYEIITYTDSTTYTSSPTVIGVYGDKGNDGNNGQNGNDGIGVQEVIEQYYLSNSNTQQTGGSWQTTQPTWVSGKYIWIRSKITWTDSTITYTTPVLASSINKANETAKSANDTANGVVTNFGTYVEQNYEHVKVAWNQISDFIQLMIINNNASFAILDENKNILMSLDKKGQHFFKNSGQTVFGEMGVKTINNENYISFSVEGEYDSQISDGMAWGITTKSDGKFYPIFYIKNFSMGAENSDASYGELVLSACNLILDGIGTGIQTGGIFMNGDPTGQGLYFVDTNTNKIVLSIFPGNIIDDPSMYILDKISFYKNNAGSNTLKVGDNNNNCLLTDDGHIVADTIDSRGYVGGLGFVNISLEENKKNFEKLENALDILKEIDIYKYNYKIENNETKKHIGVVIGDDFNYSKKITDNNNKGIDIYNFTSLCCKAIQEQQEQIEQLQEKDKQKDEIIANLITRIEALEKGVSK